MSSKPSKQALNRLTQILSKPTQQRQFEQLHFLTLTLKKYCSAISNILDWWMLSRCIQCLYLWDVGQKGRQDGGGREGKEDREDKENKENKEEMRNEWMMSIQWVFVLKGEVRFHGMRYVEGESLVVGDGQELVTVQDGIYAVLLKQTKNRITTQAEQRIITQKRQFAKKILFPDIQISQKDLNYFFSLTTLHSLPKSHLLAPPPTDTIYLILQGSLHMKYKWKRQIKLRQLGSGSIFSTFLGRYFYKTGEDWKNIEKYQFDFVGREDALILTFSPDVFYQQERFRECKRVVERAWGYYWERVGELKRIIQNVGLMRLEKQQVIKNMKEEVQKKFLREKCVSVPVAIERRKLRKIVYNIYSQKSTRRKIPNLLHTKSAVILNQQTPPKQTKTTQPKSLQKSPSNLKTDRPISTTLANPTPTPTLTPLTHNINNNDNKNKKFQRTVGLKLDLKNLANRSKTQGFQRNIISGHRESFYPLSNCRTFSNGSSGGSRANMFGTQTSFSSARDGRDMQSRDANSRDIQNQQSQQSFYRFFRPQQFISKKLRIHYQSVLLGIQQIKVPIQKTLQSEQSQKLAQSKNKRQFFEQYVNERRIVKLGPKKRLLYKQRKGF